MFSIMYWLYFDLREQLSDHRAKIQQGTHDEVERVGPSGKRIILVSISHLKNWFC